MNTKRQLNYPHVAVGESIERDGKIFIVHEYAPGHSTCHPAIHHCHPRVGGDPD